MTDESDATTQKRTVAVLGTGIMGAGMARQLARHGHEVRAWNRSRDKAEPLADDGVTVADEPAEAVRGAEVVLTMLYDADSVVDVLEQAAPRMTEQTVVVQSSTVGLDLPKVADAAERLGVRLLDAPVLGTKKPAEDGKLTVLASGDPALRDVVDPVLDAIGAKTVWVADEPGPASRLKLVCNAWIGAITAATGQSIALAEGLDLDPMLFLEALEGGAADSPYAHVKGEAMSTGSAYDADAVSFAVDGVRKDTALIHAAAEQAGVSTDLVAAVGALFDRASEAGHGDRDMAAVHAAFR